jgi:hypothetical protein
VQYAPSPTHLVFVLLLLGMAVLGVLALAAQGLRTRQAVS